MVDLGLTTMLLVSIRWSKTLSGLSQRIKDLVAIVCLFFSSP